MLSIVTFDVKNLYFDNYVYPQMQVPASVTAKPVKTRTSLGTRIYSKNKSDVTLINLKCLEWKQEN